MIIIKNNACLRKMAHAGSVLHDILQQIAPLVVAGTSTHALDQFVEKKIKEGGLVSRMKGYHGYKHATCISVNDVVVHGVPHKNNILKDGDLVKVDVCASWQGYCADMARSFYVGTPTPEMVQLVTVAQAALDKGIAKAVVGNRLTDISAAIQQEVEAAGFGVVRDFAGHGIGKNMHEDPEVLNYGAPGKGPLLQAGMVFALEPMITAGHYSVAVMDDGWTVKTKDRSLAMHVEDTVAITNEGPVVLTRGLVTAFQGN